MHRSPDGRFEEPHANEPRESVDWRYDKLDSEERRLPKNVRRPGGRSGASSELHYGSTRGLQSASGCVQVRMQVLKKVNK